MQDFVRQARRRRETVTKNNKEDDAAPDEAEDVLLELSCRCSPHCLQRPITITAAPLTIMAAIQTFFNLYGTCYFIKTKMKKTTTNTTTTPCKASYYHRIGLPG